MKWLCYIGWHAWTAPLDAYVEEFGCIPMDNRVPKSSVCKYCGKVHG